ncbi:hypothetical protein V495_03549 [Pseudogymnoascus sp. VKM F-4514 (FW-929)]|nr:hypothetical protein V495_03549 [Pseudogymnoascus sp. VKM F-4514 (FW-929)]KFY58134.1 hypothetical protein V497_05066 [Pseudogymnoascus sp. VKM F-4516 (FW-969)]
MPQICAAAAPDVAPHDPDQVGQGATDGGPTLVTQLDFISCPSSGNVSCTLPAKNYTITIAPVFNISSTPNNPNGSWESSQSIYASSHVFELPLGTSDRNAIIAYMQSIWDNHSANNRGHLGVEPVTAIYSTANISTEVDLTVEPEYNMTLTYKAFRSASWVRFEKCDDESLNGKLIGAMMPRYTDSRENQTDKELRIAGTFWASKQFLNDTVPEDKDGSGVGLKAGSGWATALIMFGVLAFNWL